jgi:hypothetical protein
VPSIGLDRRRGAGLIGAAVFRTDPVSGYPPGTPDALTHPTRTGFAHNLTAVPVFVGPTAAALAGGWRCWRVGQRRFGLYGADTAATMLTTIALAGTGFGQSPRLVNLGWVLPARQHHHRLCLAHSPVRTSAPANPKSTARPALHRAARPPLTSTAVCSGRGSFIPNGWRLPPRAWGELGRVRSTAQRITACNVSMPDLPQPAAGFRPIRQLGLSIDPRSRHFRTYYL